MIKGIHFVLYSSDPAADRAFMRDVLGMPHIDMGDGWLLFGAPPSELAIHPASQSGRQELYFMVEDIEKFCADMKERGLEVGEPTEQSWGKPVRLKLPGGGIVVFYEATHERPETMS